MSIEKKRMQPPVRRGYGLIAWAIITKKVRDRPSPFTAARYSVRIIVTHTNVSPSLWFCKMKCYVWTAITHVHKNTNVIIFFKKDFFGWTWSADNWSYLSFKLLSVDINMTQKEIKKIINSQKRVRSESVPPIRNGAQSIEIFCDRFYL